MNFSLARIILPLLLVGSVADARECLVRETEYLGSSPGTAGRCSITQQPTLEEGLYTFPYLGTRSYRVKFWKASAVVSSSVRRTYVTRIINRCYGWLVDKEYKEEWIDTSTSYSLENTNLDERIDDESKLLPMSETEMQLKWQELLRRCGH